jgi:hypothetical protein
MSKRKQLGSELSWAPEDNEQVTGFSIVGPSKDRALFRERLLPPLRATKPCRDMTRPERDRWFESFFLQRGVCKPSVPRESPGVLSAVWAAVWVVVLPDRKQYRRTGDRGDRRGGSRLYRDIRSGDQAEARGAEHALVLALLLSAASSWPAGPEFPQGYRGLSRPSNEVHKAGKGATSEPSVPLWVGWF